MGWTVDLPTTTYVAHDLPSSVDPRTFIRAGSEDFQNLMNEVLATKRVSLDTETTGLVRWKDTPLYWSLAFGTKRMTLHASLLPLFQEAFSDENKEWIFANAKYDAHILANIGITLAGKFHDTQVMHALLYEERSHKLKDMADHLFGYRWGSFEDLFGKIGKKQSSEDRIRVAESENMPMLIEYAGNDAWGTLLIHDRLEQELKAAKTWSLFQNAHPFIDTLWDIFSKVDGPYSKVLWKMERKGIKVDVDRFDTIRPQAEAECQRLLQDISKAVGFVFNPKSTEQKQDYFFNQLGLKSTKLTKGGKSGVRKPSIDSDVLEKLADEGNEVARLIVQHSEFSKLLSTYIIGLREQCDPFGRIHTSFNQFPRTGRLSSSDPNLQNIPRPDNDKWKLRAAFIPEKGKKLVVADYEQLEMRLLAAASLERDMIAMFERGEDAHMGNASLIFNLPYSDIELSKKIDKEIKAGKRPESDFNEYMRKCFVARDAAKTLGFGLVYGMGPSKLANSLKITLEEAKSKIAAFMQRFPAVDMFLRECVEESTKTGYAYTVLGRRRAVPELHSYRRDERSRGERLCVNTPIQGCLPAHVRILTKKGYIPIGSVESGEVWTGTRWAPFMRLNRGKCRLAKLRLDNGQMFDCDTRHQLLVADEERYRFAHWKDLRVGDRVCFSLARRLEFGEAGHGSTQDFYWMGYATGNGCTSHGAEHKNALSVTCGDRENQYSKEEKISEFESYIERLGYTPQKRQAYQEKVTVTVEHKAFRLHWESLGFVWGKTAHNKRIPSAVWSATLEQRENFVRGFLDADGHANHCVPNLHLCQQEILHEMALLLRTVGVESTVRGPYSWQEGTSFRLDMNKTQLAEIGFGSRGTKTTIQDMDVPSEIGCALLERGAVSPTRSDRVVISRIRHGGTTGAYNARRIFGEEIDLYATHRIVEMEELSEEQETFTLSVDDPGHRYDSEGLISKNTAADVVKMAQINIDKMRFDKYFGYDMLLQVHDEIVGECPEEMVEKLKPELREALEHPFIHDLAVQTTISLGAGESWFTAK